MTKISVFIDGGNFFDGLHAQGFSIDLDYRRLMASLADTEEENIGDIFFYIAPYPEGPYPNNPAKTQYTRLTRAIWPIVENPFATDATTQEVTA